MGRDGERERLTLRLGSVKWSTVDLVVKTGISGAEALLSLVVWRRGQSILCILQAQLATLAHAAVHMLKHTQQTRWKACQSTFQEF